MILLPATFCVLPRIFSGLLPVRFLLPCDLQEDTHDAGSDPLGLEHTPDGAGPMFSLVLKRLITIYYRVLHFNKINFRSTYRLNSSI